MFSTGPFLGSPHKLDTTIPPTLFLMLTLAAPPQKKSVIAAISHPRLFYILYIHVPFHVMQVLHRPLGMLHFFSVWLYGYVWAAES